MTTTKNKQSLRKHIRQLLTEYPSVVLSHMSGEIMLQLEQTEVFQSAAVVLLYHSLPDEVNTHAFISRWYQHKTLLLPRVDEDRLSLHQYTGPDCLSEGKWNIQEPDEPAFTGYRQISLAIVPGVAFDTAGHRLGRGKGYYSGSRRCRRCDYCSAHASYCCSGKSKPCTQLYPQTVERV